MTANRLVNEDDRSFWETGHATEQLTPIAQDDPEFRKESELSGEAFRRLFELATVGDKKLAAYLSQEKDLLDGAGIWRLSQMEDAMPHLLRKVKALARERPEEFAEPALAFFRKTRPDLADQEPEGGASVAWWLDMLK